MANILLMLFFFFFYTLLFPAWTESLKVTFPRLLLPAGFQIGLSTGGILIRKEGGSHYAFSRSFNEFSGLQISTGVWAPDFILINDGVSQG